MAARLEEWYIKDDYDGLQRLHGFVYDHPHFPDGTAVTTSIVQQLDLARSFARTLNTEYTLGAPDPASAAAVLTGQPPLE